MRTLACFFCLTTLSVGLLWAENKKPNTLDWQTQMRQGHPVSPGFELRHTEKTGWPRLLKQSIGSDAQFPTYYCDLGEIQAGRSEDMKQVHSEGDWSYVEPAQSEWGYSQFLSL